MTHDELYTACIRFSDYIALALSYIEGHVLYNAYMAVEKD